MLFEFYNNFLIFIIFFKIKKICNSINIKYETNDEQIGLYEYNSFNNQKESKKMYVPRISYFLLISFNIIGV
jgi:hypothetical protein